MEKKSMFEQILERDWSGEFIDGMQKRIITSHYKYGWMSESYPEFCSAIESLKKRLELYEQTHNTECLMDIANFAMIEFMHPTYGDAKFEPTDSDKSPGLQNKDGKDAKSVQEMRDEFRQKENFYI